MWSETRVSRESKLGELGLKILSETFSVSDLEWPKMPVTFFRFSDERIEISAGSYRKTLSPEDPNYGGVRKYLL